MEANFYPVDKQKLVEHLKKRGETTYSASVRMGYSKNTIQNAASDKRISRKIAKALEIGFNIFPTDYAPEQVAPEQVARIIQIRERIQALGALIDKAMAAEDIKPQELFPLAGAIDKLASAIRTLSMAEREELSHDL